MRILVTSGATREPIDAVRFLSNVSTGATGAALADALVSRGHRVSLLHGTGAVLPRGVRNLESFSSAADLEGRLKRRLRSERSEAVIMAAAVADYRPARAVRGKLSSGAASRSLRLVRNPKLLPKLKGFAKSPVIVIGFKLTVGAGMAGVRRAVSAQFRVGGVDAVVHNDLEQRRRGGRPVFRLFSRSDGMSPARLVGVPALARALTGFLEKRLRTSAAGRLKGSVGRG